MLAVSRGLDRDRVVDETGNQTVVFGRRGARPFHVDEMQAFLRHKDGDTFRVEDVVRKTVTEEKEVAGKKVKTTRLGVFTKSGRELIDPNPPPAPPPTPVGIPLIPGTDSLKLPPEFRPTPGGDDKPPPPPEEPKKAPDAPN